MALKVIKASGETEEFNIMKLVSSLENYCEDIVKPQVCDTQLRKLFICMLGPSGYQFEKYFSGILKAYGYSAETDRFLKGYCVTHEVDIFATINGRGGMIECKYHSNGGKPPDIKTALYVYSRFMDIKKASELN